MLPYLSLFNDNAKRAKAIAERLNGSDAHILVFQEAFSSKCRNIVSKGLQGRFPFQYGPFNDKRYSWRTNSGLWIVSQFPLNVLDFIRFSVSKGYDVVARKGAVMLEGSFHGARFQLLATHLQAEDSQDLRIVQCSEIRERLLDPYLDESVPQLLCGDFNIDQFDTEAYQQMLHLLDARNGALNGSLNVTYDEIENNLAYKENGRRRILDYALVRNGEQLRNIDRKVQSFVSSKDSDETHLSDHYGLEVSIQF
jgi:endonuclease/exonuclease/phosphatase family metal-dependent hydrolase